MIPFGEKVWYKQLKEQGGKKDKFKSDWSEGVWLGHTSSSNEVLVGTVEGVVRAYAYKRMDEEQRWDRDAIRAMKGTPARPNPNKPGTDVPIRITVDGIDEEEGELEELGPARDESNVRRMKIT